MQSIGRVMLIAVIAGASTPVLADPKIPYFWDAKEQLTAPQLDGNARISFLTTLDFPPFNFIDDTGRPSGFHVDLANAICRELNVVNRCSIQALPWQELEPALLGGNADAILAGLKPTAENRKRLSFGRPYLRFPGRFVAVSGGKISDAAPVEISGRKIGVISGSAHEAMLRDYFLDAKVVTFSRIDWLLSDLKSGKLDAAFGDGMQLSFWLGSSSSDNCCRFVGGPYLSDKYLGPGLSIVTSKENTKLSAALDYALRELTGNGTFSELYLRYFPVSFY